MKAFSRQTTCIPELNHFPFNTGMRTDLWMIPLFILQVIRVHAPRLENWPGQTHPFYSSKIKLLPTNAFQKLGMKFKVDSLQFQDGKIVYTEKSKVTGKEGSIHFTDVEGLVRNVKNIDLEKTWHTFYQSDCPISRLSQCRPAGERVLWGYVGGIPDDHAG